MDKQKVLETSGAGYIFSHLYDTLKRSGCIPMTIYNLVARWRHAFKFGPFEQGNVINKVVYRSKLLKEHGLDLSGSFEN